jgi:hypothetical protein
MLFGLNTYGTNSELRSLLAGTILHEALLSSANIENND